MRDLTRIFTGLLLLISMGACTRSGLPGTGGSADSASVLRADAGANIVIGEGDSATLRVAVRGGSPPYRIRWNQESGTPAQIADVTATETATSALTVQETLVFRVVVADAAGRSDRDYVSVEVGPPGSGGEDVLITGPSVIESEAGIMLTAATSLSGTLTYNWEVVSGDGTLTNADTATPTLTGGQFGDVTVRVRVADESGQTREAETTVRVALRVSIEAPTVAIVGEQSNIGTEVNADPSLVQFEWSLVEGSASFGNLAGSRTSVETTAAESVRIRLTVRTTSGDEEVVEEATLVSIEDRTPEVLLGTNRGDIRLELFYEDAPQTVHNFLRYVDEGFYTDVLFHRIVADFVIQAGGYVLNGDELVEKEATYDPIPSEAGNGHSNVRGTISMALRGSDANSADSQFFINLSDENTFLDEPRPNSPAFTVFGQVIEGLDVVDDIAEVETGSRSGLTDVPVDDVIIEGASR